MTNTIILVSGMPATGKTTFATWLSSEICVPLVSQIRIMEKYFELSGINEEEQRRALGHITSNLFWFFCEEIMKSSSPLIVECLFPNQMKKEIIDSLTKKYKYQTINVHLDTTIEIAHRRFHERSESNPSVEGARPKEIPFEHFEKGTKNIKNFRYGNRIIYVDTTDFSTVSYKDIVEQIRRYTSE